MNKEQIDTLLKQRSYRSVVKAGFQLYVSHFQLFFKFSWIPAAIYSSLVGAAGYVAAIRLPYGNLSDIITLLITLLLAAIVFSCALGTVVAPLKEHAANGTIPVPTSWWRVRRTMMFRTCKALFFTALLGLLPSALLVDGTVAYSLLKQQSFMAHSVTILVTLVLLLCVLAALSLPLLPVMMTYLMEQRGSYWKALRDNYRCGLRSWGALFAIALIDFLLLLAVDLIVCMPAKILLVANISAHTGLINGDELGMPGHMPLLTFVTFALSAFMQFYANLPVLTHVYFSYGSIASRQQQEQKDDAE